MQLQAAGLWPAQPTGPYIEQVFSTYLYTGNSGTQTITNGIDLSTKGGLVWIKDRTSANSHQLYDTVRGVQKRLMTDQTAAQGTETTGITAFNTSGWTMGAQYEINDSASNYASWTFRKQPKFFDVVTWTGNNAGTRDIAHNLGSTPGFIIVKSTSLVSGWYCWHNSFDANGYILLNSNAASGTASTVFGGSGNKAPTSTTFTIGNSGVVNQPDDTYVAYVFAHNAGGFGLSGEDNVVSCGSFTTDGSGYGTTTLGYEPQFVLWKASSEAGNWNINDNMRGVTASSLTSGTEAAYLFPNASAAENGSYGISINATGFQNYFSPSTTYIYIAIRRGPMRVPTSGTSVFNTQTYSGTGSNQTLTTGFPVSQYIIYNKAGGSGIYAWFDRLRGQLPFLNSVNTAAQNTSYTASEMPLITSNTGITLQSNFFNSSGENRGIWAFQRAPGFFDEVCYTGVGGTASQTHNLGVAPELMIVKSRSSGTGQWFVYSSALGVTGNALLTLQTTNAAGNCDSSVWNSTSPTATTFYLGGGANVNGNGSTYVAYLFATCAGVSKVGSYTGTATTKQIDCGFTAGARFVLIKRTDSTGDWYVWDSARGIIAGNDPYLLLNSTAAEVTNTDYVDTYSAGFEISSTAPAAINASGGTYIFLAIA
jgi:hypothetical protein